MWGSHARSGSPGSLNTVPTEKPPTRAVPENCPNLRENGRKTVRPPGSQRAASNLTWQVRYVCFTFLDAVMQWVMFSDFRDSYRIYRTCELVPYFSIPDMTMNLEIFVIENQWDWFFKIFLPTRSKSIGFRFSPPISNSKLKYKVKGTLLGLPKPFLAQK